MKNKTITRREEMEAIIGKCQVCYAGMTDTEGKPYTLPMNFGYRDGIIYLHGSRHGKKIDALTLHPDICIAFSTDHELRYVNREVACSWSMRYRSVIVHGRAEFLEDEKEKEAALKIIMAHYAPDEFSFNLPAIREVAVIRVKVERMEGRVYGY